MAAGQRVDLTDAPTWIIDPVDGTMNFVHSFPFTCVSIGELLLGILHLDLTNDLNRECRFFRKAQIFVISAFALMFFLVFIRQAQAGNGA